MEYQLNTKTLKRLKRMLPKNGMQIIADNLCISTATVSRTLSGKNKIRLPEVVQAALELIESEKVKKIELQKRINSI